MEQKTVVVIGGGAAGCAAAAEAARLGFAVTLVDEHPQPTATLSLDAPYFYGARLVPVLSDAGTIADRVLGANEPLLDCLEAGVDVLTGTAAWGVFVPGPNAAHLPGRQVGLADDSRSWMLDFDYLVLAPGARDLVLGFPGWDLPGVLGAQGAGALITRYQALGGQRIVILGSNDVGLRLARQALEAGLTVAAIVEAGPAIEGDATVAAALQAAGIPVRLSTVIAAAEGDTEVTGARLVALGPDGAPAGAAETLACDSIVMAYGMVPNIELAAVAGCAMTFEAGRGGWVPRLAAGFETSQTGIFVVGDGAGLSQAAIFETATAEDQGRAAARTIGAREGIAEAEAAVDGPSADDLPAAAFPPDSWLAALVAAGGQDVVVCQCESVTRADLTGMRPPAYLKAGDRAPKEGVPSLGADSRFSQDAVKRMTRAGMGHCQGKRCREHSAMLMAAANGAAFSAVQPGSYRVPVRPLPLSVLWADDETAEMRANWPTWLHPVKDGLPE